MSSLENDESEFEDLLAAYPAKLKATVDDEPSSYRTHFEDVTQETYSWGSIAEVYRTGENPQEQRRKEGRFGDVALVLRRIVPHGENTGGVAKTTQLEIQSPTLRAAFAALAADHVNINLHKNPIIIPEPYVELYHCQSRIQAVLNLGSDIVDDKLRGELKLLQSFQTDYMTRTLEDLQAYEPNGLITFELLRLIFIPGSLVVLPHRRLSPVEVYWAAVVQSCQVLLDNNKEPYCEITVGYTAFDNSSFGTVFAKLKVNDFTELKRITDLPVYPLLHHPEAKALLSALKIRGAEYRRLCEDSSTNKAQGNHIVLGSHCHYDGPFWEVSNGARGVSNLTDGSTQTLGTFHTTPSSQCKGRIVVDPPGFIEENPAYRDHVRKDRSGPSAILRGSAGSERSSNALPGPPKINGGEDRHAGLKLSKAIEESLKIDAKKPASSLASPPQTGPTDKSITDLQLITMPPIIPGFSMSNRAWGFCLVDDISEIQWNPNAYDALQIDQKQKDSIRKLVGEHRHAGSAFDDFVSGKGRGLVFLLHGPPGSGKTMTAETVAESLKCPLYYTTGGELGLQIDNIEKGLRLIFQRIQRWAAILLFDEADTFMARRSEDSLERNALVSILLRLLEYQSGILFLTTNRLADFDEAFYSRIHIRIEFNRPEADGRAIIWAMIAGQANHAITPDEFKALGTLPLDGRRIKNVLRVASLLTHSRGRTARMSLADVKDALQISAGDPNDGEVEPLIKSFCG
ncbi:P-loop containing nucleoside triphosphate hydrolase protein [Chaetomium tenue]|uniref:P-loop containing nucleoside triphosphate hydrolase protein n=1 Tax=Chaetomium tenue TaxID=1854479 RepID=A0ACB7PJ71_9PEZI|nr:P-loop containing nucleoside triphosphate hydrolase protein [Chaetomium globosum]